MVRVKTGKPAVGMNSQKKYANFLPAINIRLFSWYFALALIIPVITIIAEFLITADPAYRTALQVNLQDFHLYQLFTSSFVHANFDHFLGNITAYLLIVIYGLVLATILNRKRLYLVLTKVIVVVFLLFGALFAFFNMTTMYYAGLSGIDAALAGLLLLFWLMFLEHKSGRGMRSYHGVVLAGILALSAGIIIRYLLLYHPARSSVLVSLLVALAGMLVLVVFLYRHQFGTLYGVLKEFSWPSRLLTLAIIAIFWYFIWNIFPERLGISTRVVSVSLHLAGIILGIAAGYLFMIYLVKIGYFRQEKEVFYSADASEFH
jgi:membrane associated rhomboid family serine protease